MFSGLVFAQEEIPSEPNSEGYNSSAEIYQENTALENVSSSSVENHTQPAAVAEEQSSSSVAVENVWKDEASSSSVAGGLLDALYPVSKDEAIAKGRIYGGVSLSLIQGNTDEDALNILIGDVYDAYGYTFTVEAFGGYFIKDAMALGLRAGYSRTWFDVDFALMEDLLDLAEHRKYVSNGFFVQPLLKNYLKVLDSRNFYFFNETSISFEYSYGISQTDDGEDMSKSRNRSWSIDVGINPGICIMVLNRFAFETSVGLLGLSSSVIEVEENNETRSQFMYNIVNFTINLLALDFSLVYFF
ncbi:MAG: hypothetical protein MJZ26_00965 [Fibrobacter sp.]|nr:hypothetical protein [Fibrobacter sp.]